MIFERGILEKGGFVASMKSPLIYSMRNGFRYYSEWANNL